MAKTLTTQVSMLPASGATLFTKGDPLHARLMFDSARALNNLWGYCDTPVIYCMDPTGALRVQMSSGGVSKEFFVAQVPVMIPRGAKRLLYTLGANVAAPNDDDETEITSVNIYLASGIYTGPIVGFDATKLAVGYGSLATSPGTWFASGATGAYLLIDVSGGDGLTPVRGLVETGGGREGFLILTVTGSGNEVEGLNLNYADIRDFTAWVTKE
jgi:hypothetical protein